MSQETASAQKVPANQAHRRRAVFADFATVKFQQVMTDLSSNGIDSTAVTEVAKLGQLLTEESIDVCVCNLVLGGEGPFGMITHIRNSSKNPDLKIIVLSKQVHKVNIQKTMKAGANDFIADPFEPESLYNRILYHLSPKQIIDPKGYENTVAGRESWDYIRLLLEGTEILSRTPRGNSHAAFYRILHDIAELLNSNRASLIVVDEEEKSGAVLATSDDPNFHDFPVDLNKYPEVLHVVHTGNLIVVEDVSQNSLTEGIQKSVRTISIGSIMVFPVRFQDDVMGVVVIRRPQVTGVPSMDIIRVLQAIANTMGAQYNIEALLRKIYRNFPKKAAA